MRVCQFGGWMPDMYGWAALEKPKMSMTSMSPAVRRVCVEMLRSPGATTDMSTVTCGLAASKESLNSSMNSTIGGFWCTSTRSVTSSLGGSAAAAAAAAASSAAASAAAAWSAAAAASASAASAAACASASCASRSASAPASASASACAAASAASASAAAASAAAASAAASSAWAWASAASAWAWSTAAVSTTATGAGSSSLPQAAATRHTASSTASSRPMVDLLMLFPSCCWVTSCDALGLIAKELWTSRSWSRLGGGSARLAHGELRREHHVLGRRRGAADHRREQPHGPLADLRHGLDD